ncbi:hypothetical protein FQA47_001924 [Oryzias melastigma]|uniref:Uncharacterized protein n=1 Tax=Oryzias melastigma TaxID=30732 RepID=A0A834FH24_ORYME|nr:hypothetical protein FQA47_001924 [Oryzias melastigma]
MMTLCVWAERERLSVSRLTLRNPLRLWPRNLRQHLIAEWKGWSWANELGTGAEAAPRTPRERKAHGGGQQRSLAERRDSSCRAGTDATEPGTAGALRAFPREEKRSAGEGRGRDGKSSAGEKERLQEDRRRGA